MCSPGHKGHDDLTSSPPVSYTHLDVYKRQVWVHRYENLRNMAHWHFENELVVCQEGAAEIMLDGIFYTLHQGCLLYTSKPGRAQLRQLHHGDLLWTDEKRDVLRA